MWLVGGGFGFDRWFDAHVDRAREHRAHVVGEPGAYRFAYEHPQPRIADGLRLRFELGHGAAHGAELPW